MVTDPEKTSTEEFIEAWRDAPLPQEYCGVWRRLSIAFPDGSEDTDTLVLWMQTPTHHIDLRIPADRPKMHATAGLDDLDAEQLQALALQEGFAGHNQFRPGAIAWRREIDFSPPDGPPDEGTMAEREPDLYEERGIHAPYTELWRRIAGADGPVARTAGARWMLLQVGDWVAYVHDRRPAPPPPGKLAGLVHEAAASGDRAAVRRYLDCEISFGRIDPHGHAVIQHSSHPWREGERLPKI